MGATLSGTQFKIVGRSSGKNAVASAAYRSGEKLTDHESGQTKDYSRKSGITDSEILIPDHTSDELKDRETLWNRVEESETRKNSQLSRECLILLPRETTHEENKEAVFEYCQKEFVDKGMVADINFHNPTKKENPHAHVMLTTREVDEQGNFTNKNRDWNSKEQMLRWNKAWDDHMNQTLEKGGYDVRIDNRSDYEKELDKVPEAELDQMNEKDFDKLAEATTKPKISQAAHHISGRGEQSWQVEDRDNWKEKAKEYFKTKADQVKAKSQEFLKRISDGRKTDIGHGKDSQSDAGAIRKNEQQPGNQTRTDSGITDGDRKTADRSGAETGPRSENESILARLKAKYGNESGKPSGSPERSGRTGIEAEPDRGAAPRSAERPFPDGNDRPARPDSQQTESTKNNSQRADDKGRDSKLAEGQTASPPKDSRGLDNKSNVRDPDSKRSDIDESRITNGNGALDSSKTNKSIGNADVKPKRTRKERDGQPRDPSKSNRKPRQRTQEKEKTNERQRQREPEGRGM